MNRVMGFVVQGQAYSILNQLREIHRGYSGNDVWTPFWIDKEPISEGSKEKRGPLIKQLRETLEKNHENHEGKEVISRAFLLFKYITLLLQDNLILKRGWNFLLLFPHQLNDVIQTPNSRLTQLIPESPGCSSSSTGRIPIMLKKISSASSFFSSDTRKTHLNSLRWLMSY